jgi:hypothetical protein
VYTVCFSKCADLELTGAELLGMTAHEMGHIVGLKERFPQHSKLRRGKETPKPVQEEADRIAREILGFHNLRYNKRKIQELRLFK